jgi:hypothetical protein
MHRIGCRPRRRHRRKGSTVRPLGSGTPTAKGRGPRATVTTMRVVGAVAAISLLAGCGGSTRLSSVIAPDAGDPSLDATVFTAGGDSSMVLVGDDGGDASACGNVVVTYALA